MPDPAPTFGQRFYDEARRAGGLEQLTRVHSYKALQDLKASSRQEIARFLPVCWVRIGDLLVHEPEVAARRWVLYEQERLNPTNTPKGVPKSWVIADRLAERDSGHWSWPKRALYMVWDVSHRYQPLVGMLFGTYAPLRYGLKPKYELYDPQRHGDLFADASKTEDRRSAGLTHQEGNPSTHSF